MRKPQGYEQKDVSDKSNGDLRAYGEISEKGALQRFHA